MGAGGICPILETVCPPQGHTRIDEIISQLITNHVIYNLHDQN